MAEYDTIYKNIIQSISCPTIQNYMRMKAKYGFKSKKE